MITVKDLQDYKPGENPEMDQMMKEVQGGLDPSEMEETKKEDKS